MKKIVNRKAGIYKKELYGDTAYKAFIPSPLLSSLVIKLDNEAMALLSRANRSIASLESITDLIPDANLFISMYVRKEALMSSQIEGTQATLEDIFDPKNQENANRDVAEVISYIKATEYATKRLKKLPLCNRLIKEIHSVLLNQSRGQINILVNFVVLKTG